MQMLRRVLTMGLLLLELLLLISFQLEICNVQHATVLCVEVYDLPLNCK